MAQATPICTVVDEDIVTCPMEFFSLGWRNAIDLEVLFVGVFRLGDLAIGTINPLSNCQLSNQKQKQRVIAVPV